MTLEEIKEAMRKDPALNKAVVIYSTETTEGKSILKNFADAEFEDRIKPKIAELHQAYENDIFEAIGERKKGDQKAYDFLKEVLGKYKELKDAKPEEKDAKIKELNEEIKKMKDDGSHNSHWKQTFEEARESFEKKEKELKETIETMKNEQLSSSVGTDLTLGRGGLKFMDGLPQEAIDAIIATNEGSIKANAKIEDGKVVYYKEDGKPWLNKEYKPITAQEIWAEKLGSVLSKETDVTKKGGGATPNLSTGKIIKTGEGDNAKTKLVLDKGAFSTKKEFNELVTNTLKGQGIAVGTKEYNDFYDEAYKEHEVSELELK